jgi:hypothetical protein
MRDGNSAAPSGFEESGSPVGGGLLTYGSKVMVRLGDPFFKTTAVASFSSRCFPLCIRRNRYQVKGLPKNCLELSLLPNRVR